MLADRQSIDQTGLEAKSRKKDGYPKGDTDANTTVQQRQQQQQSQEEEEEVGNVVVEKEDDKDHQQHDDKILARLYHVTRSSNEYSLLHRRKEYQHRLLSFHTSTYFAKPTCLSPLFCASFG
jgi:hypothetical protein